MAFAQLEQFGSDAMFLGHAITASTIANRFRGEDEEIHKIAEFMPPFKKTEPELQTVEEQMQFAAMMTAALGGKDLRKETEQSAIDELIQEDEDWDYEPN